MGGLVALRRVLTALTGEPGAALAATALLGVAEPFWSQALRAEVYTLHALFLALILGLVVQWRTRGGTGHGGPPSRPVAGQSHGHRAPAPRPRRPPVVRPPPGSSGSARRAAHGPRSRDRPALADDIFVRDRLATAERSLLKVALGSRATVTVRELSTLTITEQSGRSAVGIESGKLSFGLLPPIGG